MEGGRELVDRKEEEGSKGTMIGERRVLLEKCFCPRRCCHDIGTAPLLPPLVLPRIALAWPSLRLLLPRWRARQGVEARECVVVGERGGDRPGAALVLLCCRASCSAPTRLELALCASSPVAPRLQFDGISKTCSPAHTSERPLHLPIGLCQPRPRKGGWVHLRKRGTHKD